MARPRNKFQRQAATRLRLLMLSQAVVVLATLLESTVTLPNSSCNAMVSAIHGLQLMVGIYAGLFLLVWLRSPPQVQDWLALQMVGRRVCVVFLTIGAAVPPLWPCGPLGAAGRVALAGTAIAACGLAPAYSRCVAARKTTVTALRSAEAQQEE